MIFANNFDGSLDTNDEAQLQARLLLSVKVRGFIVFFERLRVELIPHRPTERRTCASASSPAIVWTWPSRTSLRRRLASVPQSLSIRLASAASKLSTRRSARSARASLGKARASFAI